MGPKGFEQALGVDHAFARGGACLHLHRGGALAADLGTAFGPEFGQSAHAALIALAAGGDAFDRPFAFGLDLAVELVAGIVLFGPDGIAPILKPGETGFAAAHLAAIYPQGRACQRAQKGAVVTDQHESGAG